ncbi:MAG: hypothetical protein PHC78_11665, partial [Verrucomicrobiota bacterium]|nr:hypothetical protein [Verrucomicrobiota bacterium]
MARPTHPDPEILAQRRRGAKAFSTWLEPVRKGSRILNLTSPSGPGKPPAEGAVTFSTNLSGWVGSML